MKLAIMQPYVFPYIGYFQLINAVDSFVFYDDVNFMKHGWVNRNKILINGREFLFSIPLKNCSQHHKINETMIANTEYTVWNNNFLKSIENSYKKSPFYHSIAQLVKDTLSKNYHLISDLAISSIQNVCRYLDLDTDIQYSSKQYAETAGQEKADRLISICHQAEATIYINPVGGVDLYSKEYFTKNGIDLFFLRSNDIEYKQFDNEFIPNLSIIDVLMFNSPVEIRKKLTMYELI